MKKEEAILANAIMELTEIIRNLSGDEFYLKDEPELQDMIDKNYE